MSANLAVTESGRLRRVRVEGAIRFRSSFRNTVFDVMRHRGWKPTESDHDWDIHWADREWVYDVFDNMHLDAWQRVNHFRNGRELCRKDLLIKNVKRMRRQLEKEGKWEEAALYDFCPVTFVLPGDYALFAEEFKRQSGHGVVWIMKPIGRAQGKGIFLFHKLSQISQWKAEHRWKADNPSVESYVVQRYISNPFLIGGKKFDLRMYVLVTSFMPLKVYIYRRYSNAPSDIMNTFVHLTNVAVQKTNDFYNPDTGGKWDLRQLKLYLQSRKGAAATDRLFREMQEICIRSLFAVQKIMINDKHCFELYGYDLMFDEDLKPWLIEVNASPSLTANTREDYDLKFKMLSDTLDVIDMEGRRRGDERTVGGFDLIFDDGPIEARRPSLWSTMLGADFDRRLNVFRGRAEAESESSAARGGGGSSGKRPASRAGGASTTTEDPARAGAGGGGRAATPMSSRKSAR